jgi:tetratricopeptide (TPR) repeat protein
LGDRQSAISELRTLINLRPDFLEGRLSLAQALAQIGDWQGAAEQAQIVSQIAPGNVAAALLIIQAQIENLAKSNTDKDSPLWDSLQDQLVAIEKAIENSLDVKLIRFDLLTKQGSFAEAEALLAEIKQDYTAQVNFSLAEADWLIAQGKTDEAISVLNKAIKQFPNEIEPISYLAIILSENGDTQNSEEVIKQSVVKIEDSAKLKKLGVLLTELYNNWHQYDKNYHLLISIADEYPEDISIKRHLLNCKQVYENPKKTEQIINEIKSLDENGWRWRYEQARFWFENEDFQHYYPEIISLLEENLLKNPDDQASRILLAASHEKAEKLSLAISVYHEALNRSPRDLRVIIPMVNALYKANEYNQADEILQKATQANLFHPDLQKLELYSRFRKGEFTSAGNIMSDMLAQDPNNHSLCLSLALLKIRQSNFTEAEELLDMLEEQKPDYLPVTAARINLNLSRNNTNEALELCNKAISTHNNASAFLLRGGTYAKIGQLEQAEADFARAGSLEPNNVGVWITKSDFYRSEYDFANAVSCIRKALSIQPDNIEVCKRAILLFLSSNEPEMNEEGKELLSRSLDSNPEDNTLRIYKARQLLSEQTAPSILQATSILQELTIQNPRYIEPWILLGSVALEQDQPAKAIDVALRGLVHNPNDKSLLKLKARAEAVRSPALAIPTIKALLESEPNDVDTIVFLAETYTKADEADKAIGLLKKHLVDCNDDSKERKMNISLATALYKDDKQEESQRKFDLLYQSYPDNPTILYSQVNVLKEDQKWDSIYKAVINWHDENPDNDSVPVSIAGDLAGENSKKANEIAERLLRKSLENDPENVPAMTYLAMLLQNSGRASESVEIYQQILNQQPDNTVIMNNLAWVLCQEQNKNKEALELAERGLQINPDYIDLIDTRGMIYYKLEQYERAIHDFTQALDLYPQTAPAKAATYLHMAKALIKLGQIDDAKANLEKASQSHRKLGGLTADEYADLEDLLKEISKQMQSQYEG